MNVLAITTENQAGLNQVYNAACGEQTTLLELVNYLKKYLTNFDPKIAEIQVKYGPYRKGDIPHSLASIKKAQKLLDYKTKYSVEDGIRKVIDWYLLNL